MREPNDPSLDLVSSVDDIHRRLGEIAREQAILRRLLRLAVRAHEERERRRRRDSGRHGDGA